MTDFRTQLALLFHSYAEAKRLSTSTVSRYASGSGAFLHRLDNGATVTMARLQRIVQWFSDHWPEDLDWPADVPRPAPAADSPASEPAPLPDDLAGAVRGARERMADAMGEDWDAAARHEAEMFRLASALRPDGRIACVEAACLAVGCSRDVYQDVVRRYAGRGAGVRPRDPRSATGRMLEFLAAAGDARFAARSAGGLFDEEALAALMK